VGTLVIEDSLLDLPDLPQEGICRRCGYPNRLHNVAFQNGDTLEFSPAHSVVYIEDPQTLRMRAVPHQELIEQAAKAGR
jgi:hypothetical protein